MRILCRHIAIQISSVAKCHHLTSVFLTGGGVYNGFLLKRLAHMVPNIWVKADDILLKEKKLWLLLF